MKVQDGGELDDFKHGPSFSVSLDITKIWDSVSECYRRELLLKKVGLVSSSSLRPWGFPDHSLPHPALPLSTFIPHQLRKQKKCPRRTLQLAVWPETNVSVNAEKRPSHA